ncbi:MAG: hypothetical protein M8353_03505 [ANME-2 cluster archaeon]|nr:hypothetical protein [ANME-2 cluster archaeon]
MNIISDIIPLKINAHACDFLHVGVSIQRMPKKGLCAESIARAILDAAEQYRVHTIVMGSKVRVNSIRRLAVLHWKLSENPNVPCW